MKQLIEVIGIDHGWSNMKTRKYIYASGIKEITTEPAFYDNTLEYQKRYYKVGTGRVGVTDTKVMNDSYYLLTLAAIAKELEKRGKRKTNILLSAGLPLTRFGSEKDDFHFYLSRNKEIQFHFEKREYEVKIEKVCIYPQCYAAVVDKLSSLPNKILVIDIGSWTIDIMPIYFQVPDEANCITIPEGLITCMHTINNRCIREYNSKLDEMDMQQVMCNGKSELPNEYKKIIYQEIEAFTIKIMSTLNEKGFNIKTTPIVFAGGGATMMKQYGKLQGNINYIEDIRANALGYEYLTNLALNKGVIKIK